MLRRFVVPGAAAAKICCRRAAHGHFLNRCDVSSFLRSRCILTRRDLCQLVAATSRVFGNDWDGGVTAYAEGDTTGKSCLMPCGCTDVAWVGPAADHVAVACDDGNVVVLALSSIGTEGWHPTHVLADHESTVTSVSACPLAMETFVSCSLDHTIKVWNISSLPDKSSDCTTFKGEV